MLNPIRIVFQKIDDTVDREKYITDRLDRLLTASDADRDNHGLSYRVTKKHEAALIRLVVNSQFAQPMLAEYEEHPEMTSNQQLIAGERIQCAFDTIEALNPLLPGEQLIQQQQSYLSESYLGYVPGTGVIKQVTTMATLYFVFLDCFISRSGDVSWMPPRDREQKSLLSNAVNQLPAKCADKAYLIDKLQGGLKEIMPVPYNILSVSVS